MSDGAKAVSTETDKVSPMFSFLSGVILLVGLVSQIVCMASQAKGTRASRSTLAWGSVYGMMLLVLSLIGFTGLLDGGWVMLAASTFASILLATLSWATVGGWRDAAHM